MQVVPLKAQQSQTVNVVLGGQSCTLNVYQKGIMPADTPLVGDFPDILQAEDGTWLIATSRAYLLPAIVYLDLYVANVLILAGIRCLNGVALVRNSYFGFIGDLAFYDTQGDADPIYTGIGARFQLVYLAPGDVVTDVQTLAA